MLNHNRINSKIFFLLYVTLLIGIVPAYAEPILITISDDADKIIVDGKWTFEVEWKHSSENLISYNDGQNIAIRSAHDRDNLFFLIDVIKDYTFGINSDKAIVCIDGNFDKNKIPSHDDHCFLVTLGSSQPVTLEGGSLLARNGFWQNISNNENLQAAGSTSTIFDRYSAIPHSSYEFKIPLESVGRSNMYGIYIQIYDDASGKFYTWPADAINEKYPYIAEPNLWGEIVSPDKSIPEFNKAILVMIPSLFAIIYVTKKFSLNFKFAKNQDTIKKQ